ncbi:hypothetical protein [Caballeronia sp. CLC5]|uniref:hypothetical protein n=1 Tax=Caballeronia sp. CLC5 TaxID=2906764 RepID=UPI001F261FBB|nr:hypothetical protein [Caballeronia sp. CLC5]MCE4573007.1 hypothetical protein [Caballeronia sp. CLC5]
MASFDFISLKGFRLSLERDFSEMKRCLEVGAWKSVQVLAGSVVESLLIDYLLSSSHPSRSPKDPLRMDLAEAITICRQEKVLSDRTADLCSVIRSYRNLIHPGRVVRLEEPAPDQSSATIAKTLIEMIVEELARSRRKSVGLTAEQIVSKVRRDANSTTIVKHLILEANESQRERLVLSLIPDAYMTGNYESDFFDDEPERLRGAFRVALEQVSHEVQTRVAAEFVRILREEDGDFVARYCEAFFVASDIEYVAKQHQPLVTEFLLGRPTRVHTFGTLRVLKGIVSFLTPNEAEIWVDPYVRTITSAETHSGLKARAKEQFGEEFVRTTGTFDTAVMARLDAWRQTFLESGQSSRAESAAEMIDLVDIPF